MDVKLMESSLSIDVLNTRSGTREPFVFFCCSTTGTGITAIQACAEVSRVTPGVGQPGAKP